MNTWPDEALERTMLADADHMLKYAYEHSSAADCGYHIKVLLTRVRELEKREAELTAALKAVQQHVFWMASEYAAASGNGPEQQEYTAVVKMVEIALEGGPQGRES